jgi:peptide deformylase
MIYPIYAYGHPILRAETQEVPQGYPELADIVENMWATMADASGVGLAAPQVGLGLRLFIIDSNILIDHYKKEEEDNDFKEDEPYKGVFINAQITDEGEDEWGFEEGCLSIPGIRETVFRPDEIEIEWFDENFKHHHRTFSGLTARVIQHEYDHTEGILFVDHLKPLRKKMLKGKLADIAGGKVDVDYKMRFNDL